MLNKQFAGSACALALLLSTPAFAAEEAAAPYTLTGHVDLVSDYYLRGITSTYGNSKPGLGNKWADAPESDKPVLQWGADFVHENGWYAGYWGSMINYSYKRLGESYDQYARTGNVTITDYQSNKSIENDLYGGYVGKLGDFSYTLGMTGYYYINGKHSNAFETKLGIGYGDFSAYAQTLLNDTVWGNTGDTYWTLNYTHGLPYDITFNASLGWYTYAKNGKYIGDTDPYTGSKCAAGSTFIVSGCMAGDSQVGDAFRHVILGISQPIADTGATWSLQGIIAGQNRFGTSQGNRLFGSISYAF